MFFGVATMFQFLLAAVRPRRPRLDRLAHRPLWRIADADGNNIKPGDTGEMLLRGETIMKNYRNNPEETAVTIVDGWLHTGDLARLDPDGYMTLTDRIKDTITLPQVQEFCRERLSHYKVPHDLIVRPIPRNPSGKIMEPVIRSEMADAD